MKSKGTHPNYNEQVVAKCACGATFMVGSTKDEITTEICSNCHPFYTGKQKLVDSAGRVDKFRLKQEKANKKKADALAKKKKDSGEDEEETVEATVTEAKAA